MNTITIKVIAWEPDGQSLICKFASDETASSNPDDYTSFAFQPKLMWPDAIISTDILKEIARAGVGICEELKTVESLRNNSNQIAVYSGLVDTSQTFSLTEIALPPPEVFDIYPLKDTPEEVV